MSQFSYLQERQQWNRDQYQEERDALQLALVQQFNQIYGKNAESVHGWQRLCSAMQIDPLPQTTAQCQEVSVYLHRLITFSQ
jgi:hypothetical protein